MGGKLRPVTGNIINSSMDLRPPLVHWTLLTDVGKADIDVI